MLDHQEERDQESEVANAINDECLLAGGGRGILGEPESNQQIGRQAHTFPTDKHQEIVAGEHQGQHEKHEQIQVAKNR